MIFMQTSKRTCMGTKQWDEMKIISGIGAAQVVVHLLCPNHRANGIYEIRRTIAERMKIQTRSKLINLDKETIGEME